MGEPGTPKNVRHIQTFAFLDIESTGLPRDSPRIIELSIVAVSRADLLRMSASATPDSTSTTPNGQPSTHHHEAAATLTSFTHHHQAAATPSTSDSAACDEGRRRKVIPKVPRVLHKYTRLYYPWKIISSAVEGISGLSNEALEHLPSFTEASAQALDLFLDLPKPVALVAHNGKRFDFPILMAELNRVDCTEKFVGLQCVDTLVAVKDIDALIEREDITEITKLADSFNIDDFNDELQEEAFNPSKRPRTGESDEEEGSPMSNTPPSPYESALEVSAEPLLTPVKSRVAGQTVMPATPSKPAQPPSLPCTPESAQPGTPGTSGFQAKVAGESSKVRRTLTYENSGRRKPRWRMPYKQSNIYRRLFNAEYEAHRAEHDCLALLTICGHYGSKFVEWADTFATSFEEVKPMWVKRKSFHASQEG